MPVAFWRDLFPAHQTHLRLQRELLTLIFSNRTHFCTTVNIAFAICHCRAGTFTTCSCIVFLGSDGENLTTYSISSLEDTPSSILAPKNARANRDGRGESHDLLLHWLHWMGHREAALELCALSWNLWLYSTLWQCLPLPILHHCSRTDQFSSCYWTRGQLSSSFPPVLLICRMFRKCMPHTALFLTKTYVFKAAYNHIHLRNRVW